MHQSWRRLAIARLLHKGSPAMRARPRGGDLTGIGTAVRAGMGTFDGAGMGTVVGAGIGTASGAGMGTFVGAEFCRSPAQKGG